jgi:hypothetical protein
MSGVSSFAKLIAYVVAVCMAATPAIASCEADTIETVSDDGDLIIMLSGDAFDVAAGDDVTAATWLEGEDVLICGDTIINKDERGEKIEVTPH